MAELVPGMALPTGKPTAVLMSSRVTGEVALDGARVAWLPEVSTLAQASGTGLPGAAWDGAAAEGEAVTDDRAEDAAIAGGGGGGAASDGDAPSPQPASPTVAAVITKAMRAARERGLATKTHILSGHGRGRAPDRESRPAAVHGRERRSEFAHTPCTPASRNS
jgi:hypothetical protein